ncbi:hypothetical protein BDN71DRAFT_1445134 [Pleurotus eryngii]|uniref:Helicase C-terminal domain-containing protein n=1 Tax=Pleurotus eryngii TaxID=5323 RepID=A0A9P6A4L4_PLEER|nr:hypothetical protein BDN71DRAFT_1445134 [Pleurotus eryngii]
MAKEKLAKSGSQKTINSFFTSKSDPGRSKGPEEEELQEDDASVHSSEAQDASDVEMDESEPKRKSTKIATAESSSKLPPISSIPLMFDDLVSHIPEIKDVAVQVAGRKLRVATMCSGTESPLLALEMITGSIREQYDVNVQIQHVFSCEIEPFKQAYIERNFQPPLLFRDVCELGEDEAHTAYGSLAPVPGDVDMLIAGTSCVDYSNLNNEKQDIDANGESGRTFRGMMSWVKRHRPPIVILENVCSAPWTKVKEYFEDIDYSAEFSRADTKFYYVPHTRTRVYLLAVNKRGSSIPATWKDWVVNKLKRPATSSLDAHLLPADDPRIHQARQKLVSESAHALDRRVGRTDWSRCESRHQRARLEEQLGDKRPLTSWDDGGYCKLSVDGWGDWATGQVERVWDLMDISLLRSAKQGIDPAYKTLVWNLSQNVDRTIGSSKPGICPCLTPSMIPYITNRGGPMVGIEALGMQGLPVDKLLLTRESEDQLADLAGNAMSTTVVGACMLAALVSARKLLKAGDDSRSYESKAGLVEDVAEEEKMVVDTTNEDIVPVDKRIVGEDELDERPLDLSVTRKLAWSQLLLDAMRSSRLCYCEGRVDMTTQPLFRCVDCQTSFCKKCGGRPEHNPELANVGAHLRLPPSDFARKLKSTLPMSITLRGVTMEVLNALRDTCRASIPEKRWTKWADAVLRASSQQLRFVEPKRQEVWSAVYDSSDALLELLMHPQQPEWLLYAKPKADEAADADIRTILRHPIGRLRCKGGLFDGDWQFAFPHDFSVPITITGGGDLVPSWEQRLGLQGDEFKDRKVFSKLVIDVPEELAENLDRDIAGTYTLFERCGTANGALHRKESAEEESSLPPLFMLLDPHRTDDTQDSFVFSTSMRRYEYGETRPIFCKLAHTWRQSSKAGAQKVDCILPCQWIASKVAKLEPFALEGARFSMPNKALDISLNLDACRSAMAFLVCQVPFGSDAGPEWPRGTWREVDRINERSIFRSLAWLLGRICHDDQSFTSWQTIEHSDICESCERCAPSAPKLKWMTVKRKSVAVENTIQAGEYERRLKRRPSPFVTQLMLNEDGVGTVKIGLNVPTLLHRAVPRLPNVHRDSRVTLSWRLDTNFTPSVHIDLPKFVLRSNKQDKKHAQPPHFKLKLRVEQLRSLEWMVAQEAKTAPPFIEEEISEAMLDALGWRAEGRVQRSVKIRGGVLADQVGYGKTAITLALIDVMASNVKEEMSNIDDLPGKIPTKASLIVVPPHLTRQWASEAKKFAGKHFKVEVITTASNLNSLTIEDVQNADLVVVASNLFKSNVYLDNLQELSAGGDLSARDGRHFNASVDVSLASLRKQVDRLRDEGSAAVLKEIKDAHHRAEAEAEAELKALQSKRLKGKSYREAADAQKKSKPTPIEPKAQAPKPKRDAWPEDLVEVVIPIARSDASSVPPSSAPPSATEDSEEESDVPRKRVRTRTSAPIMVLSESESDEEEAVKPKKAVKPATSRIRKKAIEESDYEHTSEAEPSSSEESDFVVNDSSDGDSKSKAKSKSKPKPKPKPKPKVARKATSSNTSGASSTEAETDDMDVDDAPSKKKKAATKKRKADDDDERPAKKQRRHDSDPWKLGSAAKKDWTQMRAPPMEMFQFARVVVDEYTYLDGKVHSLVTRLTGNRRWVLSGTPPIHDFTAVKSIAAFLGLHLGVDDDGEGQSAEVRKRRREQTAAEKFHSFREVHSLEWHAHRHQVGQAFLDQFVRQNIAEIDEIPWVEDIRKVTQTASEYAIYLELEHYLQALEMTMKKTRKSESDRDKRLLKALGESKTAEEALLKCCSYFDLQTDQENSMKACDVIVEERKKQLQECMAELLQCLEQAVAREKELVEKGDVAKESLFREYVRVTRGGDDAVGDKEARGMIVNLLDKAGAKVTSRKGKKDDSQLSEKMKEKVWEHREKTHEIRRLGKELVGRVRSLRYFNVVRDFQKQSDTPPDVSCPRCKRENLPAEEISVLSSCGHTGCTACVKQWAAKEECVYAKSGACKSAARDYNIIAVKDLGVDDKEREGKGRHYGMKLEKIVHMIKKDIPKDERVLLFVQFPDLMKKVAEALGDHKIKYLEIKGTAHQKSKNLEKFQNDSEERVLLLNVMDESASGANLTSANHAIFMSPLLAPTKEIYQMCETQAIGRLVRFGQTKLVHVYRFLAEKTIDERIYEERKDVMMHDH